MDETRDAGQSYRDLIEPLFGTVKIYGNFAQYSASIADLRRPLLVLYAAHLSLSELHNGGLLQLFWNSTGMLVPEAIDGFRAMDMPELANTLSTAANSLGSHYPRDRDGRWDAMLAASNVTEDEMNAILKETKNLYLAFAQATSPLGFNELDQRVWKLAEEENGGFQAAADLYGARIRRPN